MENRLTFFIVAIIVSTTCMLPSTGAKDNIENDDTTRATSESIFKDIDALESAIEVEGATGEDTDQNDLDDELLENQARQIANDANSLVCPKRVKRFSFAPHSQHYYSCSEAGDAPVLQSCLDDEIYWAKKEICIKRKDTSDAAKAEANHKEEGGDSDTFKDSSFGEPLSDTTKKEDSDLKTYTEPVLGRTIQLGCLFDAQRNLIMSSDSFWSPATIEKNKITQNSIASDISFFAAQTTFERLNKLDIKASMQLEFMSGMIKVSGSAGFLNDKVESSNTVVFVMRSHFDTRDETLPSSTEKEYLNVCNLKGPTHVVTSIHYGMDAFFTFKRTAKSHESKQEIAGRLQVSIKSIPGVKIEGSASLNVTGSEKKETDDIEVKLRGDFILPAQPTTYDDSLKVFRDLTSHLGPAPDYKNAKELKMTLTPITRFCDKSTALLIGISETLINSATTMLDELDRTRLAAQTLAKTDAVLKYIPLQNIINAFITKLNTFVLRLKSDLQSVLPKIRGGGQGSGEKDLVALLDRYNKSPFNFDQANTFLKIRRRELKTIDNMLNWDGFLANNIEVIDYADANDNKLLLTRPLVVMVQFNVLSDMTIINGFLNNDTDLDESAAWFNDKKVVSHMGRTLNALTKFASVNKGGKCGYLFKAGEAKNQTKKITVYAQKDGQVLTNYFKFPRRPSKIRNVVNKHDKIIFQVKYVNNKWIKTYEMTYWKVGQKDEVITKRFKYKDNRKYVIPELEPNEVYMYKTRYVTEMGSSAPGPEDSILTRPCSPPLNLRMRDVTATSFKLEWDHPLHIGAGVKITNYVVSVTFGTQYLFVTTTPMTWSDAQEHCKAWNGNLVAITSKETNDYVLQEMRRRGMSTSWIGYTQISGGKWKWIDPGAHNAFINWARYFPRPYRGIERSYNCARMISHPYYKGKWMNNPCSIKQQFVCGKSNPKGDQVLKQVTVGSDQQSASFKDLSVATRYIIHIQAIADNTRFNESKEIPEIASKSEKAWKTTITKPEAPKTPRALKVEYHSIKIAWSRPQKIAQGAVIKEYIVRYSLVGRTGQSKLQSARNKTYVTIASLAQESTYLFSVKVVTSLGTSSFSPSLRKKTLFKQTALDILRTSVTQQIQTKVSSAQSKMNDKVKNEEEDIKALKKVVPMLQVFYPQGTKTNMAQRVYQDYDGATFIGYGYHDSHAGVAMTHGSTSTPVSLEECLKYAVTIVRKYLGRNYNGFYYAWGSGYCVVLKEDRGHVTAKGFLHYRFSNEVAEEPEYFVPESGGKNLKKKWADAEKHCNTLNGNLATITSQLVNDHVFALSKSGWIGFTDQATEGSFSWADGSKYNIYSNWHLRTSNSEPNGGRRENCAEMTGTGKWNDRDCNTVQEFVCQRKPNFEVLYESQRIELEKNRLVTTIPVLEKTYDISFEVYPRGFTTEWMSVMHMTISSNSDKYGARIPGVWFWPASSDSATTDILHVCNAISGNKNSCYNTPAVGKNKYTKIRVTQQLEGSKYIYRIYVNGVQTFKTENTDARVWENVKVYASDPWYPTVPGLSSYGSYVRNFRVSGGRPKPSLLLSMYESQRMPLKRNRLVTILPVLGKQYDVSFEVFPIRFTNKWMSIIHMSISNNNGKYGSRIPGFWFRPSSGSATTDKIHVCSAISGNKNNCYDTPKVPRREWTKLRVTQQLEGSKYFHRIYLNGVEKRKVENTDVRVFKNVKVYVPNPWSTALPGYVRNFRVSDDTTAPSFTF